MMEQLMRKKYNEEKRGGRVLDIATAFMSLVIYIVPFIILYFVISAAVKKGIESSEIGRIILEKYHEEKAKKRK